MEKWKNKWETVENWVRNFQKLCEKLPKTEWETAKTEQKTADIYWWQNNAILGI